MIDISGHYNNFQQFWGEHTEDEMHRSNTKLPHRHLHTAIKAVDEGSKFLVSIFEGRNEKSCLVEDSVIIADQLVETMHGCKTVDGSFSIEDGKLSLHHWDGIKIESGHQYTMLPCRYFSGWIQYPPDMKTPDVLYDQRDLVIHDQGGMVELDVEGKDYTVELTQLVYAHTIYIMKLAIYDLPLAEVDINSKAISYTWANPEATRIGINLRKIISGWTLIES